MLHLLYLLPLLACPLCMVVMMVMMRMMPGRKGDAAPTPLSAEADQSPAQAGIPAATNSWQERHPALVTGERTHGRD